MKDYKVSIKHYHNKNVKPSVINGENYYPIFLLITAKRKTTRFRSLVFSELYTEEMYNDIFLGVFKDDEKLIEDEITAVERIVKIIINELNEFDTLFFTAFVKFANNISIWKTFNDEIEYEGLRGFNVGKENLVFGFQFDFLIQEIKQYKGLKREITLFEFLGKTAENIFYKHVKDKELKFNAKEVLNDVYKYNFYVSMEYFEYVLRNSKRTEDLADKYLDIFDPIDDEIAKYIMQKYKP